ncbi:MAG TPA: SDR family oxidoreductase [Myxococcales bacterium]|nr:SDR family oxidoreductase [Myxococcales bacterium]HIL01604.1 SDR family oxidoreductase [Myxococcales bacterium]
MDLGLRGKVALVTGSWRGTGAGIAEMLGREGCRVLVHGFEKGQPDEVMARLGEAGLDAQAVHGDITTDPGADQLVQEALEAAGHVDVLINNYGVAEGGDWTATPTSEWVGLYQKNVLSGVRLVHALSPPMVERGWGRIVFVGTVGSLRPAARMPHYYASKAVLPNLCVSLAKELGGSGVTVNLVSPGIIATQEIKATLARRAEKKGWGSDWETIEREASRELFANPTGRIAKIEEVASLVAFVASGPASYINGANLRVDGGASDSAL